MGEAAKAFSVVTSNWDPAQAVHRFSHDAMATTFEVIVVGEETDYARQAAEAAFDELDRIERELSRFIETSDVARISSLGPGESARVGPAAFECIKLARRVHADTGGAFDVAAGTVCTLRGEGNPSRAGTRPSMDFIEIDEEDHSVGIRDAGEEAAGRDLRVQLDLGGIGKGYALDGMAELLREWSVERALVHSGQSSVVAVGSPPGPVSRCAGAWSLGLADPRDDARTIGAFLLRDGRALSGSGRRLKGPHIIDPRTGLPVGGALGAWAAAPSGAVSDALSTAFMVMSQEEVADYCAKHGDVSAMLVSGETSVFGECDEWVLAERTGT